ncbi:MAG: preprotein translocase subunit SecE [Candidatus Bathyarchaeia archaeon]|nr:preprotein translocase subunit SecE [Candidatus Bathyarchaeota archaeon]
MNIRELLSSMNKLLKVTTKPTQKEVFLLIRVSLLGAALLGGIGFIIKVLFWIVGLASR